ncbi:MAG TPA: PadR family transcriptional regulator [Kineosporiaceae bacterium]|nr:PadR family transcriptional regulator [Kineosporiaceae bacterium]
MSVTRLLVLGGVRILQPAHGYLVRRELTTWQIEHWANVASGSIYNALRTLTRDGLLEEHEAEIAVGGTGPAARATYTLTADGEAEFLRLVRDALWQLHPYEPSRLLAGLSFWWALSRDEVIAALEARRTQLDARVAGMAYELEDVRTASATPDHVAEHLFLHRAHLQGERQWVEDVLGRLRDGVYGFAGEDVPWRRGGPVVR